MTHILLAVTIALFANDNSEFFQDVEVKRQMNCTFTYVGKQDIRPSVPHIGVDEKYIYFSMEPCND